MSNLLVVGARQGSIGESVRTYAEKEGWFVTTAGIGTEDIWLPFQEQDMMNRRADMVLRVLTEFDVHSVVCTMGINEGGSADELSTIRKLQSSLDVNCIGPLLILQQWLRYWEDRKEVLDVNLHFALVSSNSASVPRSMSLPYCASKAALSMGVQCAAREYGRKDRRISIYTYEPGWVTGTPMSVEVGRRLDPEAQVTRSPGGRTLKKEDIARLIVHNLQFGHAINGSRIRIDGGEQ